MFVEASAMPFLESARQLLASGLALPEDMLVVKFGGSSYEIRRGRVGDAVRNAVGRPPMRVIQGRIDGMRAAGAGAPMPNPAHQLRSTGNCSERYDAARLTNSNLNRQIHHRRGEPPTGLQSISPCAFARHAIWPDVWPALIAIGLVIFALTYPHLKRK
jgi:hypothetical protein